MVKDNFDWEIIALLQQNSRYSYAQIGREINLSPSAVAERVQRLEESGVIEKSISLINPKKVGYSLSAFITLRFKDNGYKKFVNVIHEFPEIVDCSRITGIDCLMMKVILVDSTHLETLVDKLTLYGNPSTSIVLSNIVSNGVVPALKTFGVDK